MYICPNCNKTSESPMNFCSQCGAPMINQQPVPAPEAQPVAPVTEPVAPATESAPAPAQPTYQPNVYTAPAYAPQAEIKPVHLAKKIVAMSLSIGGLVFAGLGLLYALLFAAIEPEASFAFAFVMSFFSAPLSIVGLVMSNNNITCGDTSAMSSVGKKLGIVGIILTGAMFFIGFLALVSDF